MQPITIRDIAKRSGVSTGAVSYALNGRPGVSEETRARVLRVAEELGWAPSSAARSLSGSRTDTFGLILARDPKTLGSESFYMQFISGIETELTKHSYGLLLQVVPDIDAEIRAYRRWQAARRVDGVVVVDLTLDDPRIELLSAPGAVPAVVVGDPSLAGSLTSVWTDDATAMKEAVRYLATVGHRRIARISGPASLGHTVIRDKAFLKETSDVGVNGDIIHTDYTPQQGGAATRVVLSSADRPTAIIFDNDIMAFAGLGVANEMGLSVPADISIIAWDDSLLCEASYPPLTAMGHDVIGFGAHTARRLFDLIHGAEPGSFIDATPTLRARGTTSRKAQDR